MLTEIKEMQEARIKGACKTPRSMVKWSRQYATSIQRGYNKLMQEENKNIDVESFLFELSEYLTVPRPCPVEGEHTAMPDYVFNYDTRNCVLLYAIASEYASLLKDSIWMNEIKAWMEFEEAFRDFFVYWSEYPPYTESGWCLNAVISGQMLHIRRCRWEDIGLLKNTRFYDGQPQRSIDEACGLYENYLDNFEVTDTYIGVDFESIVNEEFGYPTVKYGLDKKRKSVKRAMKRWIRTRKKLYNDSERAQNWADKCTVRLLIDLQMIFNTDK